MNSKKIWPILLALFTALSLGACAPYQIFRDDKTVCVSNKPDQECQNRALQEYSDAAHPDQSYLLGFIEFDDQGQLWDRTQMGAVIDKLNEDAASKDLIMVTFVHGWKHSAVEGDGNIATFRETLTRLAELEARFSRAANRPARKVAGIYLGWRGGSSTLPLVKEMTFWERKNTAHKVGYGGVTEVLTRLELLQKTKDAIAAADETDREKAKTTRSSTRLTVIGHSFGGAVVFSALSQILEARLVDTKGPAGQISDARSFGDLVILINPAFEAMRFSTLSDMATERGSYFVSQLPVLAILTSEADYATKYAFPAGRWLSTAFEKERIVKRKNGLTGSIEEIDQSKANITAVGHFMPYKTHYLRAIETSEKEVSTEQTVEEDIRLLFNAINDWHHDKPGSTIRFQGSQLERNQTSAGRNPYLVIQVDKQLIRDHNNIDDPRVVSFLRQLVLLASQSADVKDKSMTMERVLQAK